MLWTAHETERLRTQLEDARVAHQEALAALESRRAAVEAQLDLCRDDTEAERQSALHCAEEMHRCDAWYAQREYARDRDYGAP